MTTTFKQVTKIGANVQLQYDELHRGQRLIVILNALELKPDWYTKSDETILEELKTSIEAIQDHTFVIERYGSDANKLPDGYKFAPKEFEWEVLTIDGFVNEDMIKALQILFYNLDVAFQEIKIFVETFGSNDASAIPENVVSLPTLNEAIIEFHGDRLFKYENNSHLELLTILNNEVAKTPADDIVVIELYSIKSALSDKNQLILNDEFSVKANVNKLTKLAGTADQELNNISLFINNLGFHSFNTIWLRSTSELFAI